MPRKKETELRRKPFYTKLKQIMEKSNKPIYLYFKNFIDESYELVFDGEEPKIKLNGDQCKKFDNIKMDTDINSPLSKNYKKIKECIGEGKPVELNAICVAYVAPLHNIKTQSYDAYTQLAFNIKELKSLTNELDDIISEYDGKDIILIGHLANKFYETNQGKTDSAGINKNYKEEISEGITDNRYLASMVDKANSDLKERNLIFFGPPGVGKSHNMRREMEKIHVTENNVMRTIFHPEYSYYDFVGQYKPVVGYEIFADGNIEVIDNRGNRFVHNETKKHKRPMIYYDFVPGPFTKALLKALKPDVPNNNVVLLIEEINRGNCAAIFGDIFQLLDREPDGSENFGVSKYPIDISVEMKEFIKGELKWNKEEWNNKFPKGFTIPSNLFIYATMNTSDQSLFPMDSAFKRRWAMEYVPINYEEKQLQNVCLPEPYKEIKWIDFIENINSYIRDYRGNEDKQIGQWFVQYNSNDGTINKRDLIEKVFSYLWFDVFDENHNMIFTDEIKSYSDIIIKQNKIIIKEEVLKKRNEG